MLFATPSLTAKSHLKQTPNLPIIRSYKPTQRIKMKVLSQETISLVKQIQQGLQRVVNAKLEVLMSEVRSIDRKFQRREAKWRQTQSKEFLENFNTLKVSDFMWAARCAGVNVPQKYLNEVRESIESGVFKVKFSGGQGYQAALF